VYDHSEGSAATRLLAKRTVPLVQRAIELSRLPVLRTTIHDLVGLVGELKTLMAGDPAGDPAGDAGGDPAGPVG